MTIQSRAATTRGRLKQYAVCALVAVAFKFIAVVYLVHLTRHAVPENVQGLAVTGGDTMGYLDPIDNWLAEGTYYWWNGYERVYAGRMPFYGLVYLPFRALFSRFFAVNALVALQLLAEASAVVALSVAAEEILEDARAFYITFVVTTLTWFVTAWTPYLQPEAFASSAAIFSLLYGERAIRTGERRWLICFGIAFGILVGLKPYFSPGFVFFAIVFAARRRIGARKTVRALALAALPTAVLLTPWVVRNAMIYHRAVPFQIDESAGYPYSKTELAARGFIKNFGGNSTYWDSKSYGCYLFHAKLCSYVPAGEDLAPGYTRRDVEEIRQVMVDRLDLRNQPERDSETAARLQRMTSLYTAAHPWRAQLGRFGLLKPFLFHSGAPYINSRAPGTSERLNQIIKIPQCLLYHVLQSLGVVGLFLLVRRRAFLAPATVAYVVLLFPIVFRGPEYRYFQSVFPSVILGAVLVVLRLFDARFRAVQGNSRVPDSKSAALLATGD